MYLIYIGGGGGCTCDGKRSGACDRRRSFICDKRNPVPAYI